MFIGCQATFPVDHPTSLPNMKFRPFLFVAMLASWPSWAHSQAKPFGISMGLTARELQRLTGAVADTGSRGVYNSTRVPSPNQAFESYHFLVAPSTGLCKLWAIGKTIGNDAYGSALRSTFESLEEALDQKYGPHERNDFLKSGSIWDEPREWMESLTQKERVLSSYWGLDDNAGKTPPPVEAVVLKASGLSRTDGWVTLTYEFSNADKCLDEIKKLDNSSL